jgi:hypothetical protein
VEGSGQSANVRAFLTSASKCLSQGNWSPDTNTSGASQCGAGVLLSQPLRSVVRILYGQDENRNYYQVLKYSYRIDVGNFIMNGNLGD